MSTLDDRGGPAVPGAAAARFRAFARRYHPDVGGDPETFRLGLEAFRAGRSPFEVVGEPDDPEQAVRPCAAARAVPEDDPRLDAPVVAVSGHVLPRTLRAGRRWLGRAPLNPVRTRRVV